MNLSPRIPVVFVLLATLVAASCAGSNGSGGPVQRSSGVVDDGSAVVVAPPDSQRLSVGSTGIVFVEFLDFECEACRAAHPAVEQLRADFGDKVTFVVRHFPLHKNSEDAARAAEAAAAQGQFEAMYSRLFETQPEWGERSDSQRGGFFGFAEDLGLGITAFREVYDDPAVLERIRRDKTDGALVGVTGTPTFFLDGEKLEVGSFEELVAAVQNALSE